MGSVVSLRDVTKHYQRGKQKVEVLHHLDLEVPAIECVFVEPDNVPAAGAGETALTVAPAAIGNAVFDATGIRLRDVPFTPERLKAAQENHPNSNDYEE